MVSDNLTIAEQLKPPFIVSLLHDREHAKRITNISLRPSDQMVSLAPSHKGFLGLETMQGKRGEWFTLTYWQNLQNFNAWRQVCKREVSLTFNGESLEKFCSIKVTDVKEILAHKTTQYLTVQKPPLSTTNRKHHASWHSNLLPSIMEFFGHASIRPSR